MPPATLLIQVESNERRYVPMASVGVANNKVSLVDVVVDVVVAVVNSS